MLATAGTAERSAPPPVGVANLFNSLTELAALTAPEIRRGAWLDGFLLAAGMSQIVDDFLEADVFGMRRTASYLAKDAGAPGRVLAARVIVPVAGAADRIRGLRPAVARVRRLARLVDVGLDALADRVVGGEGAGAYAPPLDALARVSEELSVTPAWLPRALRDDVVRVPACFRNFDQHPRDLERLCEHFAAAHPDRAVPLLLIGIRTSGVYLAPLCAAYLRRLGYAEVHTISVRPGRRISALLRARARLISERGGLAVLCDDPPGTGSSIARIAAQVQETGIPANNVVLLLALFADTPELPPSLSHYDAVLLPFAQWSIHSRLSPEAVRTALRELPEYEAEPLAVECVELRTPRSGRGHLKAVFRVEAEDAAGERRDDWMSVEGVGLGYFGNHAVAVAEPLREYLPHVIGVRDGLLFRNWLPEAAQADPKTPQERSATAARVVDYVLARNRLLRLRRDVALRQSGQDPAWEVASAVLSRSFGRAWPAGRVITTDRFVKRLLRVSHPSVIDGRVDLSEWFGDPSRGAVVKVDWDQGSSWNLGLACCDPVFDIAGVTARTHDTMLEQELQRSYETTQGEPIEPERWLLYQLAHLTAGPGARREDRTATRRGCARAIQTYFRSVYFGDIAVSDSGPLCGIDIDGVTETEHLGFPALTPASALGLRALLAHGYRPVLVTGRSLTDVVDRCRAYGLPGGVAEYGLVTFDARDGESVGVLSSPEQQAAMARLREQLSTTDGVLIDGDYMHAIRAYARDGRAGRAPLPAATTARAKVAARAEGIRSIDGEFQTDFVPESIDKGKGVRALTAVLAPEVAPDAGTPLVFAIGDTASDVALLALAEHAYAPRHATAELAGRFTLTRAAYQAGFSEAVGRLIGHRPGGCPACRIASPPPETRRMLALLALRERGMSRLPLQLLKLIALR